MKAGQKISKNPLQTFKRHISAIFLFFFIFSANALCYGSHFVEEFGHDHAAKVDSSGCGDSAASPGLHDANHHHNDHHGTHQGESSSCCDSHSHTSLLYHPLCYKHAPQITSLQSIEPFRLIPEVYLDKFIPPQNLA